VKNQIAQNNALLDMDEPATPAPSDAKVANRTRFELELEFVQALANPFYLHSLAQQSILEQPAFINYLKYLLYWKEKDYARFIQCVRFSLCGLV
jgi:mediator of RNA polymerase II transcription subunit 31